jgi:hypothetical protein
MYKIVLRSIFYHWFAVFVGISIGFLCNSEYVGEKSIIVERSIRNIFFPIKYDDNVEMFVKNAGRMRLWALLGCPDHFEIVDELVKGEEHYWAVYNTKDKNGKIVKDIGSVRIKWKTWEYYYKLDEIIDKHGSRKLD